jgi:hypothetical protein
MIRDGGLFRQVLQLISMLVKDTGQSKNQRHGAVRAGYVDDNPRQRIQVILSGSGRRLSGYRRGALIPSQGLCPFQAGFHEPFKQAIN